MLAERETFEARLDRDPPRAARVAALLNIAAFDATIACWDAKYTYWARRPFQLDPDVRPLFQTPAHPSYPAAHGCVSRAQSRMLAYLFPSDAEYLNGQGDDAGMSRLWAGIHFRSDIDTGLKLGRAIADLVVQRAEHDVRTDWVGVARALGPGFAARAAAADASDTRSSPTTTPS
jgi:PAP2 superfamily